MMKEIIVLFLIFVTIVACTRERHVLVEEKLGELDAAADRALTIKESLKEKKGNDYLDEHDRYHDAMLARTRSAMRFLEKTDYVNFAKNDLKNLARIAEIAQDEQRTVDILEILFERFPDTKYDKRLLESYFPNAYLLDPDKVEQYVDIGIFPPVEQVECYYALALGASELGMRDEAGKFNTKANDLLRRMLSERVRRNTIPVVRFVGLRSFIEYRLGRIPEAYAIIRDARRELTDEYSIKQFDLYENRLKILGETAGPIEYQFWVGTEGPLDLATLKGNVVLLQFFTWNCEACTEQLPLLFALKERFKSDRFKIIGVTQYTGSYEHERDISELREYEYIRDHYRRKRKIDWPVAIVRNGWMDAYGISSYPVYILIDKDGIVRDGYFISNFAYLKKKIEALLEN
jgi:peroxiredoxin